MREQLWSWACCYGLGLWWRRTRQRLRLRNPWTRFGSFQPVVNRVKHFVSVLGEAEGLVDGLVDGDELGLAVEDLLDALDRGHGA